MQNITGLRSPHAKVGRIVYFGRMLDKIRLHARGALPIDYLANLGSQRPNLFDGRCCRFLGLPYEDLRARALRGGCDEEILYWAHAQGGPRSDEDCLIWNRYMAKMGWRDDRTQILADRVVEFGFLPGAAQTLFELLDLDEGRPAGATRSWEGPPISVVAVMGVSGCGKTTIGRGLAEKTGWEFLDADDLHPASNIAKMSSGVALDDADRAPWLAAVRADFEARVARGARIVVACSALKEAYRDALAPDPSFLRWVHLRGEFELIKGRLAARGKHYMKETLLRSQFDTLEAPLGALGIDAANAPGVIIDRIQAVLGIP